MSHRAVNWALEQRHLKPGPWIVLIQLGDRHNKDTLQVNPEQATLAADCNMSRATVNRHLDELEALDLVRRVPRQHPVTKKRLSTFYILGLDFDAPPNVEYAMPQNETWVKQGKNENIDGGHVADCDTETVSQNRQKPCLKNSENRVANCDTNPVREPVKEPCAAPGAPHTQDFDFGEILDQLLAVYPRPGHAEATEAELRKAIGGGADPDHILAAARAYAGEQKGNKRQYIAYSENWLSQGRWKRYPAPGPELTPEERQARSRQQMADAITSGKTYLCVHISAAQGRELVQAGLVTKGQCREAGVHL